MNNNETFSYKYSAKENAEVKRIRSKYANAGMSKDERRESMSNIEQLRELDSKVKLPATVFAYVFGVISAIIMGCGMSLIMTDISDILGFSDVMVKGIIIGVVGMVLAILNYPIYHAILKSRRKKYADRVIELSNKISNGN